MYIPLILDIAIGLIFIYLILSLLASEIQELFTTIFQWRAEHLKKSIEVLLKGGNRLSESEEHVIDLVNKLYRNPLISNINQEAKGWLSTLPRQLTWTIAWLYRSIKNPRSGREKPESVFGDNQHSGPSYIPSELFATTLLETLEIPTIFQKLSETRLEKFKNEQIVKNIQLILADLENSPRAYNRLLTKELVKKFDKFKIVLNKVVEDYKNNKTNLATSIERLEEKMDLYITITKNQFPEGEKLAEDFTKQLLSLKKDIFGITTTVNLEKAVLLGELEPSFIEVIQCLNKNSAIFREIKATLQDKDSATYKKLEEVINMLPESLRESLTILARRAESKITTKESEMNQLRLEIEVWFERSMQRASGVYKRNAKGVAIIIGCVIACAANADTFHIINRLSKDSAIRTTIAQNAGSVVAKDSAIKDLNALRDEAIDALADTALPIGWTAVNLEQQIGPSYEQQNHIIKIMLMVLGWILTGVAIAMGASFWFDLLGKVVNVRNAGKSPGSITDKSADSESN